MANLKYFRREVKINFAQTLCRFEGINLTDIQAEKLLNNDNFAMLDFPEDESLIINNVINTLNYMESLNLSKQNIDLNLYIQLNSFLAKDQALFTGDLRNGLCSIPCIGQIPVPSQESVQNEICKLNNVTKNDFKTVVSECFCNLSKMQPFWDGNKRTTLFLCNAQLIKNDFELLIIKKDSYAAFEEHLTAFYTENDKTIVDFLAQNCFIKTKTVVIDNSVYNSRNESRERSEFKQYFSIPLCDKDEAKMLGAKWDRKIKHWYAPEGTDLKPFIKKGWKRLSDEEIVAITKAREETNELRRSLKLKLSSKKDTHQELSITKPKRSRGR